jgi:hypothetical protein
MIPLWFDPLHGDWVALSATTVFSLLKESATAFVFKSKELPSNKKRLKYLEKFIMLQSINKLSDLY